MQHATSITLNPIHHVEGTINLPGSKSLSNRALLLAALARGTTKVSNLLDSDDIRHMLNALKHLGVQYSLSNKFVTLVVPRANADNNKARLDRLFEPGRLIVPST